MRKSRNVVFDTNVWVSYFLKNKTSEIFDIIANAGIEVFTCREQIEEKFSGCRDPKDNYLFDLAIQSNADYLVSGDRDVRETETEDIEVVSLTKFKEILRNKNRG